MLEFSAVIIKSKGVTMFNKLKSSPFPQPVAKDRLTCEVLCFEMQIIEFVDVANVHLLLIQFSLIEVL